MVTCRIEDWQFRRLMVSLNKSKFRHIVIHSFFIREEGIIDEVVFRNIHRPTVKSTLSKKDIQWYNDTWFTQPHLPLMIPYGKHKLVIVFWTPQLTDFETWLRGELPDVSADNRKTWIRIGQFDMGTNQT